MTNFVLTRDVSSSNGRSTFFLWEKGKYEIIEYCTNKLSLLSHCAGSLLCVIPDKIMKLCQHKMLCLTDSHPQL